MPYSWEKPYHPKCQHRARRKGVCHAAFPSPFLMDQSVSIQEDDRKAQAKQRRAAYRGGHRRGHIHTASAVVAVRGHCCAQCVHARKGIGEPEGSFSIGGKISWKCRRENRSGCTQNKDKSILCRGVHIVRINKNNTIWNSFCLCLNCHAILLLSISCHPIIQLKDNVSDVIPVNGWWHSAPADIVRPQPRHPQWFYPRSC